MSVQDYPITTPYGQVPGYPLNNGFHTGIDYGCPTGTPVIVNGVTIGLTGSTGASTGPHLHVGRWVNGQPTNPGSGGFQFSSAVVTQIAQDATNGKYVRVQADGASWVYLHLSVNTLVQVGQVLKGGDMITANDTGPVRIIMSEVEGWNGNDIHSGKDDAQIMGAWQGHEWTEFIWHAWNVQKTHRQEIADRANGLQAQVSDLSTKVDSLTKVINVKEGVIADQDKTIKDLQSQLSVQSQDTQLLNGFGEFLRKLIVRLGLKG